MKESVDHVAILNAFLMCWQWSCKEMCMCLRSIFNFRLKICLQENPEIQWANFKICPPNFFNFYQSPLMIMCAINYNGYPGNLNQIYQKMAEITLYITFLVNCWLMLDTVRRIDYQNAKLKCLPSRIFLQKCYVYFVLKLTLKGANSLEVERN